MIVCIQLKAWIKRLEYITVNDIKRKKTTIDILLNSFINEWKYILRNIGLKINVLSQKHK